MKKRYTAAMLVAAMLMMNPKLPIRASHAHAEGEEEQANEANSSEQPGAGGDGQQRAGECRAAV